MNWQKFFYYCLPFFLGLAVFFIVNIKTDLAAFMVAGDNAEEILLASEMQSGSLSRRYLISVDAEAGNEVSQRFFLVLLDQLKKIEGVIDVWSPGHQQGNTTNIMQTLYSQYGNALYSLNPEQDLPALFTPTGLKNRAKLLKQLILSPQGSLFKKIALQDPLLLTINGFQSISAQMEKVIKQSSQYQNLILETAMAGLDSTQQRRIQQQIKSVFDNLLQTDYQGYQLEMTGVPVFAVATQGLIQGDIIKISIISSVALMFLFLLIFRSFLALFQVFTLLAIVMLSSMLSTQFVFGSLHGMTIAIGSTLVGICIDYPIHAVAHAQTVMAKQRKDVISKIWPSMLLGGMTTMIGYVALGVSGYPGFKQVAVYAVTGIIISLLLTRFVFPKLLTADKCKTVAVPLVTGWARFCQLYRKWLVAALILVSLVSLQGFDSLVWMEDMQQLTPELNYLKLNDKRIRSRMTSIEPGRFILISGENIEQALQTAEAVYPVLDKLKNTESLADYFGLYPWLLSAKKQQSNQSKLNAYLTVENQKQWQDALHGEGLSVKKLGILDYQQVIPLTYAQLLKTSIAKIVDSRVVISEKQTIIMIWLSDHQPEIIKTAMDNIAGAQYFSQRDMLNKMTKDYTERAKKLLAIGLLVIVIILIVSYRSFYKAVQTLLPAFLSAFIMLSFWAYFGLAISFLHLVGFLLVIAICVDYGIFYRENRGGNLSLTYQAMSASMLTSALAFGSLMTAESTSLRILASVVALGVFLGFVLCPLIISTEETTH